MTILDTIGRSTRSFNGESCNMLNLPVGYVVLIDGVDITLNLLDMHRGQIASHAQAAENSLAYERLAKEGRKFGLALWLSTQRPSEISPPVLSQCNNWVSFRLTYESDLAAIQTASEWADRREVKRIAGLARQNAIIFGGSLSMPTLIRAPDVNPKPRLEDAAFDRWAHS